MSAEKLEQLESKIDTLSANVQAFTLEMRTWRAEQAQVCLGHREKTDKLCKVVTDGNGTPSLQARMQDAETCNNLLKWVVGLVAPSTLGLLGVAVWHYLRNAPLP